MKALTLRHYFSLPWLALSMTTQSFAAGNEIDIGGPNPAGVSKRSGDEWTITVGGADIWGTSDQFHFAHQSISGNGVATVKVESLTNSHSWAKAGIMVRADTTAGAAHATAFISSQSGASFTWRPAAGGESKSAKVPEVTAPVWLKIERNGDTFSAFYSKDGKKWTALGTPQPIAMKRTALAGLAVTSHADGVPCTASLKDFAVKR